MTMGVCACELDDVLGSDQSFDVKCGGLHQVVTEVVPVSGGEDEKGVLVLLVI